VSTPAVEAARKELQAWLADLAALKPFADPNKGDAFFDAWKAALAKAEEAAEAYAKAAAG